MHLDNEGEEILYPNAQDLKSLVDALREAGFYERGSTGETERDSKLPGRLDVSDLRKD